MVDNGRSGLIISLLYIILNMKKIKTLEKRQDKILSILIPKPTLKQQHLVMELLEIERELTLLEEQAE